MSEDDLYELKDEPWMMRREPTVYDHIHWSIINDEPLCKGMGTTTQEPGREDGLIYLLGRARDGRHYRLKGPFTKDQFMRKLETEKEEAK